MADVLFLVITVAFFAAAAGFVTLCDRVIESDPDRRTPLDAADPDQGSPVSAAGIGAGTASRQPAVSTARDL
jgi:hypothetical protein